MDQLLEVASRLRHVRRTSERFLILWASEHLARQQTCDQSDRYSRQALEDPFDHDWTLLYRGSVLDD